MLTKLISENRTNWDEHLSTMLCSYKIVNKVVTRYTPYQVMYGLHPLMPIECIVPIDGGNERDNNLMKVLTSRITELEKFECRLQKL